MTKICRVCGKIIYGRQRKYCKKCKFIVHKQQMNTNYAKNKCKWLCINGKYNKKDTGQNCNGDPLPFNDHMYKNPKTELMAIETEMKRLGLKSIEYKFNKEKIEKLRHKKYYENNKNNNKYKSIFSIKIENYYISTFIMYNIKTNHIGIRNRISNYSKRKGL